MRIAVIGTGYVGLVSGSCFADFGHQVTCVDKDERKITALLAGRMPIWEPGLEALVATNVQHGRLAFTTDIAAGGEGGEALFIAVGTPTRGGGGHADLSFVYSAAKEIAKALRTPAVVVTKSTVPVGTGDEIARILKDNGAPPGTTVASNPEFLREGAAIRDFKLPDRIVVGADDERSREVLSEIYRPLFLNEAPVLFTGRRTAELIKYSANAFLATKISFINEIAALCEVVGADVQEVARGMGLDNRIGLKFLHAGPGYGGSCFPKDTLALLETGQDNEAPLRIVETVVAVNDQRKRAMARKVANAFGGNLRGKSIAILGVTFKPDTDDMRDAPSIPLITALQDMGAEIRIFDPVGMEQAKKVIENVTFCQNAYDCARGSHAIVIVTEWEQFRALDLKELATIMACPVIVDLRNIYSPEEVRRNGFLYCGVGQPKSVAY